VKAGTERREMKKMDGRKDFQNKDRDRKDFEKGKPGKMKVQTVNKGKAGRTVAEKDDIKGNRGSGIKREDWKNKKTKSGQDGNTREDRKAGAVTGKWENKKAGAAPGNREDKKRGAEPGKWEDKKRGAEPGKWEDKKRGAAPGKWENKKAGEAPGNRDNKKTAAVPGNWDNKKPAAAPGNRNNKKPAAASGNWDNRKPAAAFGDRDNKKPGVAYGDRDNRKPGVGSANKQIGKLNGDTKKNGKKTQFIEKQKDDTKKGNGMAVCPVSKKCGGCQYQGIPYQEQLKLKEKEIRKWIGKFCKVNAVIGMENPYHYRNKVHAVFDRDKRGNPICGVYQAGTHNVVPIESCMIEDQKADEIIQSIRGLLKSFKIRTYDEDTGYGLLRHVLVKRGFTTNEIMVVLVTASPVFPSKNNFVGAIRKLHPEITTIIQNVNARGTSMVLGDKEKTLFGKGYIEDVLCGCTFRISSKSFYQVNPVQTEVLYKKAIDAAGLTGKELVIDAYCGIGTIGLIASKKAKRVIGVELNNDAVRDAITNAKRNEIENVKFYGADAGDFMADMAAQGEKADVVFMDPPRSGSTEQFMDSMVQMGPEKVVYVSCNPETLGRDLEYLAKKGYGCKGSWGVDMFAWTGHVETVVLLEKKS